MSKQRVLIIDDDQDTRYLFERTLSRAGFQVIQAKCGKEGIEQAKSFLPEVIVLDIMMPELDGIATVLKLRAFDETASIPIIICSSVKEGEDRIVAQNLGVADYIHKTSDLNDLIKKINKILG